jgi:hypothetical protein
VFIENAEGSDKLGFGLGGVRVSGEEGKEGAVGRGVIDSFGIRIETNGAKQLAEHCRGDFAVSLFVEGVAEVLFLF